MSELKDRIREARAAAGFAKATAAARAKGFVVSTYLGYENGDREPGAQAAVKIAQAYGVTLDWLLLDKGPPRPGQPLVQIRGRVGAGAVVTDDAEREEFERGEWAKLPRESEAGALVVEGDSMRPRFFPGEIILFDPVPLLPEQLVDRYAVVVDDLTAARKIKMLRHGRSPGVWRLESHNADPEEDVVLRAAHRWLGVLAPRDGLVVAPLPGELRGSAKRRSKRVSHFAKESA
jgi:phage repressor protein C with HTH and peptisase S24 domain